MMNKKQIHDYVMEKANSHFGCDPAYFGGEGLRFIVNEIENLGYSYETVYNEIDWDKIIEKK